MTPRESILVCILPDLKTDTLQHYVINAALFARQAGADIHFLGPPNTQGALNSAISGIPGHKGPPITAVFHPMTRTRPSEEVQEAVELYSCDLIVVPFGSVTAESGDGAQIRKELLEQTSVPLLILSPEVDLGALPIGSLLVPMSGEIRVSSALAFGLKLASRIHVPVDLVHVVIEDNGTGAALETVGDQPQHEYRELLDRVLAESSPFSDVRERSQVRSLYHVHGNPSVEILKAAKKSQSSAIVAQWHGSLLQGRAQTLKDLFQGNLRPVFLVKAKADPKSTLKIGPDSQAA